jgi:hypothetical protein
MAFEVEEGVSQQILTDLDLPRAANPAYIYAMAKTLQNNIPNRVQKIQAALKAAKRGGDSSDVPLKSFIYDTPPGADPVRGFNKFGGNFRKGGGGFSKGNR